MLLWESCGSFAQDANVAKLRDAGGFCDMGNLWWVRKGYLIWTLGGWFGMAGCVLVAVFRAGHRCYECEQGAKLNIAP